MTKEVEAAYRAWQAACYEGTSDRRRVYSAAAQDRQQARVRRLKVAYERALAASRGREYFA